MTLKIANLGSTFSISEVEDSWYGFINNGEYTPEQESAIVKALTNAQVDEFEALLPDGYSWSIHASELQYPADDDTDTGDLEELMQQAVNTVIARIAAIESAALASIA